MKLRGIAIKGIKIDGGKVKAAPVYRSVSDRIRARKSKKVRVGKPMPPA